MTEHDKDYQEIVAVARGDEEAFNRLYRLYRNRVYGFAYRMLCNQSTAEDVTHEAFLVLIQHPDRYRPERGSMLTFLCAVARNHILKHYRRLGHEIEWTDDELGPQEVDDCREANPLSQLLEDELAAKVNDALARLPLPQREVLVLREFDQLSYYEIATVIGVEVGVVKVRLHRARQVLARRLAPYVSKEEEVFP